jgi:hypothetical protein
MLLDWPIPAANDIVDIIEWARRIMKSFVNHVDGPKYAADGIFDVIKRAHRPNE